MGEMGLAIILLIGATLLIRTFVAIHNVDPGFTSHHVLTIQMSLTGPRFTRAAGVGQLVQDGTERLGTLPSVEAAGSTCCIPLEGGFGLPINIVGRPLTNGPNH